VENVARFGFVFVVELLPGLILPYWNVNRFGDLHCMIDRKIGLLSGNCVLTVFGDFKQ
jgi:hypothetical protein